MITGGDILDFVLQNKQDKVFKGYTVPEIAGAIQQGIEEHTLFYATENEDKVVGMILAIKFSEEKVLFVIENLAMTIGNLKKFAALAQEMYPGWRLEAMRHGKHRKFNTSKLYDKLSL